MEAHPRSSRIPPIEGWIAAVALLVRLAFLTRFSASPFFEPITGGNDRSLYDSVAQAVAAGHGFPHGVFEYMPLYPWFLGAIYHLFGPNLFAAGFVGALIDAATAWLIVRLARRLAAPPLLAALAGLWYALYPLAIAYSVVTMPNTLNAFLLALFTSLLCRWWHEDATSSRQALHALALGGVAGVTALGFAGMLLIFAAALIFRAVSFLRLRPSVFSLQPSAFCFLGLLGFLLPIAPVTIHNWRAGHEFVLLTAHGGFNLYMGNHENATGYPVQIAGFRGDAGSLLVDARREAERQTGHPLSSAAFSRFWSQRARQWVQEHPAAALRLMALKFVKFWNHREYDDLRLLPMLQLQDLAFTSPLWPGWGWMSALALTGLLAVRGNTPLRLTIAGGLTGVLFFFITSRYRLTLAPELAVLAALAARQIWQVRHPQRHLILLVALPLGLACAWAPLPRTDFRALDHYNTAAFLLQKGLSHEAESQARRGLDADPSQARLYFVLGNALFIQRRFTEARTAFEASLKLHPDDASAHYNLSLVCRELGDRATAQHELDETLRLDPSHPQTRPGENKP